MNTVYIYINIWFCSYINTYTDDKIDIKTKLPLNIN